MSKEPFPCSIISTLKSNLEVKLEEYKAALEEVRETGTVGSVERLRAIEAELTNIKTAIEEELNKAGYSLETPETTDPNVINQKLQELGSKATIDTNIEGGIISFTISPEHLTALQSYDTAIEAYRAIPKASTTEIDASVDSNLEHLPWHPITNPNLETVILNHGKTNEANRDLLVQHMETLGYRPLHLSEFVALSLTRPDLNRRDEFLNTYEKHEVGGLLPIPYIRRFVSGRSLGARPVGADWSDRNQFVFVRV